MVTTSARPLTTIACALTAALVIAPLTNGDTPAAGASAGPGLALLTKKALTAVYEGRSVVDNACVLIRDGKIEAVGPAREITVPDGYEVIDLGRNWLAPGMIDLHSHIAGTLRDINSNVFLTNPGLRVEPSVTPGNAYLDRALAGGVTSVLYIPGSASNIGGEGVLLRTGYDSYEDASLRRVGSMKLAQAGNPERWGALRVERSFMNWNTRNTLRRGVTYAKRWEDHEQNGGPKPDIDPQFEVFRSLVKGETTISTHTQMYQVVLATLTIVHDEFGLPVFIDHGTFNAYRAGGLAQQRGVPAIIGPRQVDPPTATMMFWAGSAPERMQGIAAGYQERGHKLIGFNTDAIGIFGIGTEELSMQAAVACRYGFDNSNMDAVRGLTIVPAIASKLDKRLGSIEVGKEADLLVVTGDPADPRASVEMVFLRGEKVYDTREDVRRF